MTVVMAVSWTTGGLSPFKKISPRENVSKPCFSLSAARAGDDNRKMMPINNNNNPLFLIENLLAYYKFSQNGIHPEHRENDLAL
jgi:hypothetical protein